MRVTTRHIFIIASYIFLMTVHNCVVPKFKKVWQSNCMTHAMLNSMKLRNNSTTQVNLIVQSDVNVGKNLHVKLLVAWLLALTVTTT